MPRTTTGSIPARVQRPRSWPYSVKSRAAASHAAAKAATSRAGARAPHGARAPSIANAAPTRKGGKAVELIHGQTAIGCQPLTHQTTAIARIHQRSARTAT